MDSTILIINTTMKKLMILASLLVLISLSSCKKDYDCCVERSGIESCIILEDATKDDKETQELAGYTCEKQ